MQMAVQGSKEDRRWLFASLTESCRKQSLRRLIGFNSTLRTVDYQRFFQLFMKITHLSIDWIPDQVSLFCNRMKTVCILSLFCTIVVIFNMAAEVNGGLFSNKNKGAEATILPCECPTRVAPVCGNDRVTYQNECKFKCALTKNKGEIMMTFYSVTRC